VVLLQLQNHAAAKVELQKAAQATRNNLH
jgi:hypothetical protein